MFGIVKAFLHGGDLFTLCELYCCKTSAYLSNVYMFIYFYMQTRPKKNVALIPQSSIVSAKAIIWPRFPKYLPNLAKFYPGPKHPRKYLHWNPHVTELSNRMHTYCNRTRNLPLNFKELLWPGKRSGDYVPLLALPGLMQQNYIFRCVHIIPKHIQSRLKHSWQSRGAPGYCRGSYEAEQKLSLDCVHKRL